MARSNKQDRQRWLAAFERAVTDQRPDLAGRIEWDTAIYLFNTGATITDAVTRYLASH